MVIFQCPTYTLNLSFMGLEILFNLRQFDILRTVAIIWLRISSGCLKLPPFHFITISVRQELQDYFTDGNKNKIRKLTYRHHFPFTQFTIVFPWDYVKMYIVSFHYVHSTQVTIIHIQLLERVLFLPMSTVAKFVIQIHRMGSVNRKLSL